MKIPGHFSAQINTMIGFACTWAESRSINRVQIEDRIVVLERRSEEHSTALLHVQEFSAQIAAMNARLDGIYQLVNVMKDDTSHQLDTLNRRMDAMQQQIGDHH
jgi:Tfp pilus assembly protein PilN